MQPAYYSEYAKIQQQHWWYRARAEILAAILHEFVTPNRTGRLLDIGCGPGGMRPMLSRFGQLVSTDFTFDALQFCKTQQLDYLVAADGMKLPFGDERFEAACAFDVIEHLSDDAAAAAELHRVLKPRGILIVTVPAFQFLWGRQDIVSHHHRRYNAAGLRRVLAGFDLLKVSYFNTYLFAPIAAVRLAFRLAGLNRGKSAEQLKSDFALPAGIANRMLYRIFAAEKNALLDGDLPFGVSLLAVAQKSGTRNPS